MSVDQKNIAIIKVKKQSPLLLLFVFLYPSIYLIILIYLNLYFDRLSKLTYNYILIVKNPAIYNIKSD